MSSSPAPRRFLTKRIVLFPALIAILFFTLFYFFHYRPNAEKKAGTLWKIVSVYCDSNPHHKPCLSYNKEKDYVLLKDMIGKVQVLLLPIHRLHGIESSALANPETPNYFKSAWDERHILSQITQYPIKDENISLSINSRFARSQNQLHIHMSCLKKEIAATLHAIDPAHLPDSITLLGNPYQIHMVNNLEPSPFLDLNREENFDKTRVGKKTLIVTAAPQKHFYVLTGETNLWHLDWGSAESLQDHDCKIALTPSKEAP